MAARMIWHGALVFLVGMLAGFGLAFAETGIELWGVVLSGAQVPGSLARWKMTHLEGIMNGTLLIAIAAAWKQIRLSDFQRRLVGWGLIVTAWCNVMASLFGALFGGRGLKWGLGFWNDLNYNIFIVAIVLVMVAVFLVGLGARRAITDEP